MKLAPDFVIMNDGAAPSLFGSLSMLGIGVLIGFFMLRKAGKSEPAAPPPPAPNLPPRA